MDTTKYDVTIELTESLLGTVPKNKDVYSAFVAKKAAELELAEEEVMTVEDLQGKGWTGFHRDAQGYFLYNYAIKGFFKEASDALKVWGAMKALKSKVGRYLFVNPRRIYLPEKPVEALERPLRAMTMAGPRVSLVKSDYLPAGNQISFELESLDVGGLSSGLIKELLSYGTRLGIGQWRSGSYGTFEVISFEEK